MLKYGSDKPDLRNPILISDVSDHFQGSGFGLFARIVEGGGVVRAIPAPGTAEKSRKFFDDMNDWARAEGHAGPRLYHPARTASSAARSPRITARRRPRKLVAALGLGPDDGIFFAAGKDAAGGQARRRARAPASPRSSA